MPADEEALGRIDSRGPTKWSGTVYRHTAPGHDALSGEGARLFGGRWNPPESFATIYFADSLETCVAEFRRMAEGQGRGTAAFRPRALHVLRADELEILDLSSDEALADVGLTRDDIGSDDRSRCQEVGEGAYFLGMQGVLAPSAARSSGIVLVAFSVRLRPGQLDVVEETTLPGAL